MFHRLFVANRGEVAARVVRACRELGIEAVCGASTADLEAGFPYLEEAAEVHCLGPGPAAQSYLRMEALVQAARQCGCAALHPGWGFLAENPRFAALCAQFGVIFVGPSPALMDQMGLKVAARAAARAAGLPVVPGSPGLLRNEDEARAAAREIGFPVLLKADAGGGGRGIRRCADEGELCRAWSEAAAEARSAFGNPALYLEKYLEGGRHVEIQVLGDGHGAAIHLGDRECSVQRRHQKLLEEAPSPVLSAAERERIGNLAAAATARWSYAGAGTFEFLRSPEGEIYFLEMNTRLQVEHPVTEAVTGIDLAQAQIRIAAGEGLPCAQEDVRWRGHAIEARINAEDPEDDFRPSPGTVKDFRIPARPGLRVDSHLRSGSRIPPHYDSLVAKLIVHAPDRATAIEELDAALAGARIEGVPTTIPLQRRILAREDFRAGIYDTRWLEERVLGD